MTAAGERATADSVEVRELRGDETAAAVALLARGMCDNPVVVAAFGRHRERGLVRLFGTLLRAGSLRPLCAVHEGTLVAVAGSAEPGACRPTTAQRLRYLPCLAAIGPAAAARGIRWLAAWAEHDPDEPHVHLGPVAVEPALRGRGIGGRVVAAHGHLLDAAGSRGYLETDRAENVAFYRRYGYVVTAEADVLGVPNWFMTRS